MSGHSVHVVVVVMCSWCLPPLGWKRGKNGARLADPLIDFTQKIRLSHFPISKKKLGKRKESVGKERKE